MIIENKKGNYSFVRGNGPFSSAVAAHTGFEIVHARLKPFIALEPGYALVEKHIAALGRPITALCGMQLRIPAPLSPEGFNQFNRPYVARLKSWGLEVDEASPVTRTNVALESNPLAEPMLAGFFYTVAGQSDPRDWVLSGAAELSDRNGRAEIVARGDTSAEGMRKKAECVIRVLGSHLEEMGLAWDGATAINLYTVQELLPLTVSTVIPALGEASHAGITWHYSRPPVTGLELEIDAYAVRRQLNLSPR
jgi:hypothetical protein